MWTVDSPVYFTLPFRLLDGSGDPVTTLVTGDFTIDLSDPAGVDREALVTLAHQAGAPGLYGGTFAPDAAGIWRLSIRHDDYGLEATQQFEVEVGGSAGYTGGTLTDIASVRVYLGGLSTTYTDGEIQAAIDWACAMVETYCNRTFASTTYTEQTYNGHAQDVLYLNQYPVTDVAEVLIDDEEVDADDYTVETEGIYYEDGWPKGRRNISVTYTAGYTTMPADLHMAVTRLAADILVSIGTDGTMLSEKIGDYSYTKASATTENGSKQGILAPYASSIAKYRRMVL